MVYTPFVGQTYASNYTAFVNGNYGGFIKFSTGWVQYIANIPSLLYGNDAELVALETEAAFIVNKWTNLPYNLTTNPTPIVAIMEDKFWPGANLFIVNISWISLATLEETFSGSILQSFWWDLGKIEQLVLGTSTIPTNYNSCEYHGTVVNHGQTRGFYSAESWVSCVAIRKDFSCENGTLKDELGVEVSESNTFTFGSCVDDTICKFDGTYTFNGSCFFGS